jgi:hypothetical protein
MRRGSRVGSVEAISQADVEIGRDERGLDMVTPSTFGWTLVVFGLVIAAIGLVWIVAPAVPWLGRLPGDIRIESGNVRFYLPLMTCLLLSLGLTLLLWVIRLVRS